MKKSTLCVVFGGKSSEYEVSLRSAYGVITHIDEKKYDIVRLGITRSGEWYIFEGENEEILTDRWHCGNTVPVALDLASGCLVSLGKDVYATAVDLFFPVLHGEFGEDGRIQALFDLVGAKYVGCGAFCSHICMDKSLTKAVAKKAGIAVAKGCVVNAECRTQNAECRIVNPSTTAWSPSPYTGEAWERMQNANREYKMKNEKSDNIVYPVFVKPTMCGSSVGVSRVDRAEDLPLAVEIALRYGKEALIEEYIDGIEVEIGILESGGELILSQIGTVLHKGKFYDYETKYKSEENEYLIPAPVERGTAEQIRAWARELYVALGCNGLARLDFFVKRDGEVVFNEINTMPGFTEKSMYPRLFGGVGLDYTQVVDTLIENVIC